VNAASTSEQVRTRDVPESCTCQWLYLTAPARWVRVGWRRGCPWHTREGL